MLCYLNKLIWEKIAIMSLKGSCKANTNINSELIIFIICISIKLVKLSILENCPGKIVSIHIKFFMRFK